MNRTKAFVSLTALFFLPLAVWAGSVETHFQQDSETERTPLDLIRIDAGYVFESKLSFDDDDNLGDQDAFDLHVEYAHRFHLSGHWYLRTGVAYNRFEFGETFAPVPDHLHSLAGVVALDYMVGADTGLFLELRPGFYAEDTFHGDSFDVPITLARVWVLRPKQLYLVTGVNVAFLRSEWPVLPVVGLIWEPNERWKLFAVVPEPRLSFKPSRAWEIYVGGQLTGGSFRTNGDDDIFPQKLSNAVVDYTDVRATGGVVFHPSSAVSLDLGGGYSIDRRFNFGRAGDDYDTDPAPFVRAAFRAEF